MLSKPKPPFFIVEPFFNLNREETRFYKFHYNIFKGCNKNTTFYYLLEYLMPYKLYEAIDKKLLFNQE
jgi:hypothetical protein